eukprot:GILI01018140.1.p1 GENE.GILI01018140.1~~GILI01018140.1.p1  ORF type:complete len:432 (-),score=46.73 GILI01018140.1:69-1364(-)
MSKNISLSSAKPFPCWTSFSSRFGGLRPSFLKNRVHHWHPSGIARQGLGTEVDLNLASLSVDRRLGRIRISPHATFAYPTTHVQLRVRFEHTAAILARAIDDDEQTAASSCVGSSSMHCSIDIADLPQSAIAAQIEAFSMNATSRFVRAQDEKRLRDIEEASLKDKSRVASDARRLKDENLKKTKPSALPHEALQLLIDTPTCELYSNRINAYSLFTKAQQAFQSSSRECYCIVMATDCRVLPAAEIIANTFPHKFNWLPMEMPWLAAGPLAPDSVFRSPVHSTKPLKPLMEASLGGGDGMQPQQPVQLRALVPIVDPATDLGLDMTSILASPIAISIYAILFTGNNLSTIPYLQTKIRDTLIMPLLLSHLDKAPETGLESAIIRSATSSEGYPRIAVNSRTFMRCCGWHHFSRWLGGIDKVVDNETVRLV